MNQTQYNSPTASCRAVTLQERVLAWLKLLAGAMAVLVFIFGVGTLATYLPGAKHMAQVIEERDLRATAIFYTDFKESAEGSEYIRDCLEYPPDRTSQR